MKCCSGINNINPKAGIRGTVPSEKRALRKKGIVMVSVLFIMLLLGPLLSIAFLRLDGELEGAAAQSKSTTSLFAAEAGLERAISILRTSPTWRTGFTEEAVEDMGGNTIGYYTLAFVSEAAENPWTRITVTSIGVLNQGDTEHNRTIQAEILTANPGEFFAFTTDKAKISNMADIQNGSLYARELEFSICEAYPNDLVVNQPTFYFKRTEPGYILSDPNGDGTTPDIILNVAPEKLDRPVAFPSLDMDYYRNLADPQGDGSGKWYFDGDHTFDDGITLDEGDNGVIFVDGNVEIKGEIEDPVVIVASEDIYITGDITWTEDGDGNPIGKVGLFAKEDIYVADEAPSDINIRAMLLADGGTDGAVFEAKGETGSKTSLNFRGSMSIRGGKGEEWGAINLSVYGNRIYNYDDNLKTGLPYVTYIAHLDSWEEI